MREDVREAQGQAANARAAINASKAKRLAIESQASASEAQCEALRAEVSAADIEIAMAAKALSRFEKSLKAVEIVSPSDGVVESRSTDPGERMNLGPLFVVAPTDLLVGKIKAGMGIYPNLHKQLRVRFSVPNGEWIEGRILRIANQVTEGRWVDVELAFPNTKEKLLSGIRGTAMIDLYTAPKVIEIPTSALWEESPKLYCYRVQNNRLVKTLVKRGRDWGTQIEIVSGLEAGDVVANGRSRT